MIEANLPSLPSLGPTAHVVFDQQGRACIDGTSYRVDQLAIEHAALGWTAEELYVQHYRQLTLAQIHAALSYYYDHQSQFDEQIRRDDEAIERLRNEAGTPPFVVRMRREGRLR